MVDREVTYGDALLLAGIPCGVKFTLQTNCVYYGDFYTSSSVCHEDTLSQAWNMPGTIAIGF